MRKVLIVLSFLVAGCHGYQNTEQKSADAVMLLDVPVNTEEYKHIAENDFRSARENPLSTFSIDVDNASYSHIRRFINGNQLPPTEAVRIEEMINYFKYDYPRPVKGEDPFKVYTESGPCPWNKKNHLVHIGIAGREIDIKNAPPNNLTFLIDVSGSMSDDISLVKSSLKLLVEKMRPHDKIAIVVYAGAAGLVLPSTNGNHKDEIIEAIDKLEAGGSTAGGEGILLAYKVAADNFIEEGNNRIILATDGDFNVGISNESELVKLIEEKREEKVFLTVLGFGTGNYKDAKMEAIADKGNGNYYYIDNLQEAKKVLVNQLGGTLYTIAKDVKIQVEFNPAFVKEYRLIGYENRMMNSEDFRDDKKDAGELGAGHTVTALYEIVPAVSPSVVSESDLRYQTVTIKESSDSSHEWMYVKLRYKEPGSEKGKEMSHPVSKGKKSIKDCSEEFRFAASVACFGQLLKDSKYKGDLTYSDVKVMAQSATGKDEEGYRHEFIRLVDAASIIKK